MAQFLTDDGLIGTTMDGDYRLPEGIGRLVQERAEATTRVGYQRRLTMAKELEELSVTGSKSRSVEVHCRSWLASAGSCNGCIWPSPRGTWGWNTLARS